MFRLRPYQEAAVNAVLHASTRRPGGPLDAGGVGPGDDPRSGAHPGPGAHAGHPLAGVRGMLGYSSAWMTDVIVPRPRSQAA